MILEKSEWTLISVDLSAEQYVCYDSDGYL